jgi:hypothetical protein
MGFQPVHLDARVENPSYRSDFQHEVVYDLHAGPSIYPQPAELAEKFSLPVLDRDRLLLGRVPIAWRDWVEVWQQDQSGRVHSRDLVSFVRVLPAV